ncbi:L-cysteine desulfidase family protein [Clostridium hydrogenum]|uniref:L-cysteine desulfidase family protein n=1 Tax=Clostridium hydrogenum TaxID=2855764 RepID=UPI001F281BE8|nr:L-serine ammonia-lyase, iron-sulfur-dependent, subunit alpha [Clostridium hydrogenum]
MYKTMLELLNKEVVLALGCTEPVAVALATAKCRETLGKLPETIEILASANILKNGMGVGIPGTGMIGLHIAAALGAFSGNSNKLLEVLSDVKAEDVKASQKMIDEKRVNIKRKDTEEKLYIEAICKYKDECSRVIIKGNHTNIVMVEYNGKKIFEKGIQSKDSINSENEQEITVDDIYKFVNEIDINEISFLLKGALINKKLSDEALINNYGLGVGKNLRSSVQKGIIKENIEVNAKYVTAAAVDARMAGCPLPVMTNSGSGNQGITVSLPVLAVAEKLEIDEETLIRALALSNLIAIHIKRNLGRLSALCGCVVASTGACCGITYILGGKLENIKYAIKNMIGDISGMVCDGAKCGCALKVSTGVSAAIQASMLALNDVEISQNDGIIDKDVEKTIKNLCELGTKGLKEADDVILNIMTCK